MHFTRRALAAALLGLVCTVAASAVTSDYKAPPGAISRDLQREGSGQISPDARQLAEWILKTRDHRGRPFAIVDKKAAHLYIFDTDGRVQGETPVLLGEAPGDDIAPEVGEHAQQGFVPFHERTTPAGRFVAEPGVNNNGEQIIWVDYDSAFAIHRLRPGRSFKDRESRLASAALADRRASSGCVVVPARFFEDVVQKWLGDGRSVVYVMPENSSARELFSIL